VPGALAAAGTVVALDGAALAPGDALPTLELTAPTFELDAVLAFALPLFVVTMARRNVPG